MMTIVTYVTLKEGVEPEWDAQMRERMVAARQQPGWISGQLLIPLDGVNRRVIVGTWQTRAHWEAWHNDAAFTETRRRLAGLEAKAHEESWHEVIESVGQAGASDSRGVIAA
jgi:heme-degrading monooxygenase HmoA